MHVTGLLEPKSVASSTADHMHRIIWQDVLTQKTILAIDSHSPSYLYHKLSQRLEINALGMVSDTGNSLVPSLPACTGSMLWVLLLHHNREQSVLKSPDLAPLLSTDAVM